jgi:DnaA-homolog protein
VKASSAGSRDDGSTHPADFPRKRTLPQSVTTSLFDPPPEHQLALDLHLRLQPTLDNFVLGRNRETVAALRRVASGVAADRIVYLWGEAGCGRSHLLQALADLPGGYVWSTPTPPERPGVALVDDVDRLDAAAQVSLFNRLNAVRASESAACVIAGPLPPAQMTLREDLRTRLAWGLVYELHALSDWEKVDALTAHAASRGLHLANDVIPYLLNHLPRDMRTLVAALDALDAYALARKRPLTLALVRDAFAASAAQPT